ncbi:MAG TPA: oxygenase MpaB family protein [Candidatus Dormibacteraeota bacterium]|nr:oxygenase MpaB family protein [Candidatus Dormibacteraeota bacterium]
MNYSLRDMPAIPLPGRDWLLRQVTRPLPFSDGRHPLHDVDPDPGLFGPESVTWRVMREPLLILGGGRALLMQAAHPLVAQGAIDHSTYRTDPFGRLQRTITWVTMVTFGTTAEARAASRVVNRLHERVAGALPRAHATARLASHTKYTATDAHLLLWVHATFVDTMIATHDALVGGLSDADRDRFVHEWRAVARLMRVPRRLLWPDYAAMRRYIAEEIAGGPVDPGAGSRMVARTVLHPPLTSRALTAAWELVAFSTVGLLPPEVRNRYDITWTPAHEAAHAALRVWLRTTKGALPRRLRISPVHDYAIARVNGELGRLRLAA